MKKTIAVLLSVLMVFSAVVTAGAKDEPVISYKLKEALYVHAVAESADSQAWSAWQSVHDEKYNEINSSEKYFFLPNSADSAKVDVYG